MSLQRIMVVDGEPAIRTELRELLEAEGYTVAGEAKNGEEAVELAFRWQPDLILMEVKLPGMNGIKAARTIRSFSEAAIVFLTECSHKSIVRDAKEAGAAAYLMKPVAEKDLIPAIEMALGQKMRLSELGRRIRELQSELETRKMVEKAKGKVMERFGLKEEDAFRWLQKESMHRRLPLAKVAQSILLGAG